MQESNSALELRRLSMDVENPTPLSGGSRSEAVQAWEFMGTGDADEEDVYLRDLAGVETLGSISSLRLTVNTSTTTISHLGPKLPHLQELNLTGSVIECLRDLGTGFQALQVLWVSRCGLPGLDGLSALPSLRELYAAYNDIADLNPLDCCPLLEVLDVEGNCVEDVEALQALGSACPRLQSLTLADNPVAACAGYRGQVWALVPSLITLDDSSIDDADMHAPGPAGGGHAEPMRQAHGGQPAAAGSAAAPSAGQESELQLVREGIKHARVGVDSAEFRELEMTLLMAAELPPDDGPAASLASSMLPASASSWLRCSQQGSLPSMQRLRGMRSAEAAANGAGGSPRTSAGSCSSAPLGNGAGSSGGSGRPDGSGFQAPPSPKLQRLSTSNARPPSGRPGTASLLSTRPSTSAPPTASIAGGLYWRKNRLSGARLHGSGGGSGQDEDEEEGETASSLLTFGVSKAATMGGSLVKDLRRRKHASAASEAEGDGGGLRTSLSAGGAGGGGAAEGGRGGARGAGSTSYDSSSLLEALRQWKVETADRVLMPAEDEASGAAWPDADGGDAEPGRGGGLEVWREAGGEGRGAGGGEEEEEDADVGGGGAEVLRLGSARHSAAPELDATPSPSGRGQLRSGGSLPAPTLPASPPVGSGRRGASAGLGPTPLSPASARAGAAGKPPLIPLRNGSKLTVPSSPPTIPQLGPVQGHRPSRPSKMLLCKVLFETSGRVLLTNHHSLHSVHVTGQESLSIKSRPHTAQLGATDIFPSAHANPLFATEQPEAGGGGAAPRGLLIVSCCPEINIRTVNPTPVMHIEDDGDSSDGELASMYS